ncbi:hypothetical protein [Cellulomonas triticagri]|uniref:Uncharacterized protein n=1 Tax=Cellulomonas triticagri TaxID=2483352 RepID=A0A3M2IXV5_9CELL|nr:hypothetical protein [Cellulomonas triticagri]RMI06757.1 hypothetical protein EBM89_15255 [Cellulomonas triticagri]
MSADTGRVEALDAAPLADEQPRHDLHDLAGDPGTGAGSGESGWLAVLADMESAADRAEQRLRVGADEEPAASVALTEPWRLPRGLGALPRHLAARAGALVERQHELMRRTADQMDDHRRRLRATDALRTRAAVSPVYLDVEG